MIIENLNKSKEIYLRIARGTGVFTNREIEALSEELDYCGWNPQLHYIFFEEKLDDIVVGFAIIDKVDTSELAWDIYWLVVDKNFHGRGYGKRLLQRIENFILQKQNRAILRLETSSLIEFSNARSLYIKQGYRELARIVDFYAPYNDLVTYVKEIKKNANRLEKLL